MTLLLFRLTTRCTSMYGTPTMFIDMVNLPDLKQFDVTSLQTGIMAGAPCLKPVVQSVADDLHMPNVLVVVVPISRLSSIHLI